LILWTHPDFGIVLQRIAQPPHKTLRVTPAMAGGVTDRVWDMTDVAAQIAVQEAPVAKRGSYKKKAA
jgi:hypothetical protein